MAAKSATAIRLRVHLIRVVVTASGAAMICATGAIAQVQTGLTKVLSTGDSTRLAVVFIHGIFSDGVGGWTNPTSKKSFPQLLCSDPQVANATCLTVTYFSPKFKAAGTLDQVARQVEREVTQAGLFRDYRHVVLIGHSMGGLIARKVAVGLNTVGNSRSLGKLRGVITLATPTAGAPVAAVAKFLSSSGQLAQLDPDTYRGWLSDLDDQVAKLREERDSLRHYFPRFFAAHELLSTYKVKVVPELYAKGSMDGTPEPMTADHIGIAKPQNRDAEVYKWVRSRITNLEAQPDDRDLPGEDAPDFNLVDAFDAPYRVGTIYKVDDAARRPSIVDTSLVPLLRAVSSSQVVAGVIRDRSVWLKPLFATNGSLATVNDAGAVGFRLSQAQRAWAPDAAFDDAIRRQQMHEFSRTAQSPDTLLVSWRPRSGYHYFLITEAVVASEIAWAAPSGGAMIMPDCTGSTSKGQQHTCKFPSRVRMLYRGQPLNVVNAPHEMIRQRRAIGRGVALGAPPILPMPNGRLAVSRITFDSSAVVTSNTTVMTTEDRIVPTDVIQVNSSPFGAGWAIVKLPDIEASFTPTGVTRQEWSNIARLTQVAPLTYRVDASSWRGNPPRPGKPVYLHGPVSVQRSVARTDTLHIRATSPGPQLVGGEEIVVRAPPDRLIELEFESGGRVYRISPSDTLEDDFFEVTSRTVLPDGATEFRLRVKSKG
jgi:pimeloyl-ACP methyl ester carboxylesterase